MARKPRLFVKGCPQHIIQRGNNRQPCFKTKADYLHYLYLVKDASDMHSVAVHAYVLMTNHIHMLVSGDDESSIPGMMHSVARRYSRYFNSSYDRTGTLWDTRYFSSLVATDQYFFTVSRYIELNPVRAAMVIDPAEYTWSSYRHNAKGVKSDLLKQHEAYLNLSQDSRKRLNAYQSLFKNNLSDDELKKIRTTAEKGCFLGTEKSKRKYRAILGDRVEPQLRGGDRRSTAFQKSKNQVT